MTTRYVLTFVGSAFVISIAPARAQIGTAADRGFEQKLIDSQMTDQQNTARDQAAKNLTNTPNVDAVGLAATRPNDVLEAVGEVMQDRVIDKANDGLFGTPAEEIYRQHNESGIEIPKAIISREEELAQTDMANRYAEIDSWTKYQRKMIITA